MILNLAHPTLTRPALKLEHAPGLDPFCLDEFCVACQMHEEPVIRSEAEEEAYYEWVNRKAGDYMDEE